MQPNSHIYLHNRKRPQRCSQRDRTAGKAAHSEANHPASDKNRREVYPTLKTRTIAHASVHKPAKILIEDTGVGTALVTELQNAGLSAIPVKPEHDKLTRMSVQSAKFESGQVFFPNRAPWLADLETEVFAFPHARHDDQVDSISQALAHEMSRYGWDEKSLNGLAQFTASLGGWR
jgi:predicted phage terminase large subunit-like protein